MSRTIRHVHVGQSRPGNTMYKGNLCKFFTYLNSEERREFLLEYNRKDGIHHRQRRNAIRLDKKYDHHKIRGRLKRETCILVREQ